MTKILSQEEIDALLNGISTLPSWDIKDVNDLAKYLVNKIEKNSFADHHVNLFQGQHITISRQLINDVYTQALVKEPKAIVKIGNIEIIPINICPSCKHYHYDEEVQEIYNTSMPNRVFQEKNKKLTTSELLKKWRLDNRTICCKKCNTYFQPTIAYSETENSDPYLCKYQTIKTLDDWFIAERKAKIQLFSAKTKTITFTKKGTSFLWDTFLKDPVNGMETCPKGLMTNIVRYTPFKHLEKMLKKEKTIPVFDSFNFDTFYKSSQVFNEI